MSSNETNSNIKPFARTSFELAETRNISKHLSSPSAIGYYLSFLTYGLDSGFAFALFLDKNHRLVKCVKLKQNRLPIPKSVIDAIDAELENSKIKYFLVAHNHKDKPLIPSADDMMTTEVIAERYRNSSAKFIGHYITSGFDYIILTPHGHLDRCYKPRRRN